MKNSVYKMYLVIHWQSVFGLTPNNYQTIISRLIMLSFSKIQVDGL